MEKLSREWENSYQKLKSELNDSNLVINNLIDGVLDDIKVVTLIGSTKFKEQHLRAKKQLSLKGWIVIDCAFYIHSDKEPISEKQKDLLDMLHLKKILLADKVLCICPDGYIGSSTSRELDFCESKTSVIFWDDKEDTLEDIIEKYF